MSFNLGDLVVPEIKPEMIAKAEDEVTEIKGNYGAGLITNSERYNQIIDVWTHTNSRLTQTLMTQLSKHMQGFNPVYMMLDSGAVVPKNRFVSCAE